MDENVAINDFVAQFLSGSLEKEGIRVSPLEIEMLYFFKNANRPVEKEDVIKNNDFLEPKVVSGVLAELEKKKYIQKQSPYRITPEGERLFARCRELQNHIEPIMKSDVFYGRLYHTSSTSIRL